jgi:hypothetical protein
VIDIGDRRAPAIVKVADALHLEVRRHFLCRFEFRIEILVGDVLEMGVARAARIERQRAECEGIWKNDATMKILRQL